MKVNFKDFLTYFFKLKIIKNMTLLKLFFLLVFMNIFLVYTFLSDSVLAGEVHGRFRVFSRSSNKEFDYAGAMVKLYYNDKMVGFDITDDQGFFHIFDVPVGVYELIVDEQLRRRINISNDNDSIPVGTVIIKK